MFYSGRYRCRSEFSLQLLFLKAVKSLFRNMNGEVKHSSQIGRKALKKSSYNIMVLHISMKLYRVHMAVTGNTTIIFLVALLGIWLKCRPKIHTDINLNNKQIYFTVLQMAEGTKHLQLSRKHNNFVFSPKQIISSGDKARKCRLLQQTYTTDRWQVVFSFKAPQVCLSPA